MKLLLKKNKLIYLAFLVFAIILIYIAYVFYFKNKNIPPMKNNPANSLVSSIVYKNTDYGFSFSLPANWKGYSIIKDIWEGTKLTNTSVQSGPKLLIRNPKWTAAVPYEDLPILIFTIPQWNAYIAESFSISAAPIEASELSRNNAYVFALPPRWDFDYSLDFKEAEDIIAGNPLKPFNVVKLDTKSAKP